MNESLLTSPISQEYIQGSANEYTTDDNIVDCTHSPDNEIHLTQQWPQSGEELPIISPGDNIEKTVHLNSDGTMTVEMRVRFKIREDETINWSTTVSRAELSHNNKKLFCSSVNPETQTIDVMDSPVRSMNCKSSDEDINTMEANQLQENDINTNTYTTSSSRTEKCTFYRPPTPGIRKGHEKKLSVKRTSEITLQETMKQMLSFDEMENELTQNINDDECNKQEREINGNDDSTCEASLKQNEIEKTNDDNFGVLETTHMELLHKNTVYEKGGRKCERSNYMSFTGTSMVDRPHSAGKKKFHQDQINFKEIKRSMSTSVIVSEQSALQEEIKDTNMQSSHGECLDMITQENEIAQMVNGPSEKFTEDIHSAEDDTSAISGDKVEKSSENDTGISNDNHSTTSSLAPKKKKKKKILSNPTKHEQDNMPQDDHIILNSLQLKHGSSCGESHHTKNIMFEEIFPPHIYPLQNETELGTTRKLKGNKQMAKVKPRSLKANDELIHNGNQNNVLELISRKDISDHSSTITSNEEQLFDNDQTECSLTEIKSVQEEIMPKKNSRSKGPHNISKKSKSPKKKKNRTGTESTATNGSDGIDLEKNDSPTLQNTLESYVQNWLKNIFPNVAFPVLQPFLSTRLGGDITNCITNSSNGSCTPYVEISNSVEHEISVNGYQNNSECEENQVVCTGLSGEKEIPIQQVQPFDEDVVSSFIEKSQHLADLFAQQFKDFGCNSFNESSKSENLMMGLTGNEVIRKSSIDAAVQVENNNTEYITCELIKEILAGKYGMSPPNITLSNCRRLEKSLSLPISPSAPESSSPKILLAWLIVLQLKQSMSHIIENIPNESNNSFAIFTLLQSLKKLAIIEKADDLKAIVLDLQESALRSNLTMKSVTSDLTHKSPIIQPNSMEGSAECINECNNDIPSIKETSDVLKSEVLIDDIDDFRFLATQPYRELSSECSQNEKEKNIEHSLLECKHSLQNSDTDLLQRVEQTPNDRQTSEEHPLDLSPRHSPLLMPMNNVETCPFSPQKTSRVKMMVQEMEQRKISSQHCEQKCLQSPISSDWSDYRQDSEESLSDTLRASSEIMTESGEEQIHEKPCKKGYVKRAIERLYGRPESKIQPSKSPTNISYSKKSQCKKCSNKLNHEYVTFGSENQECKENKLRSISSPGNKSIKMDSPDGSKSVSVPLPLADGDNNGQRPGSSQSKKLHESKDGNMENGSHRDKSTTIGVLIDKGRWLLKENHLLRRSPPEATGMYINLETTSGDTLLDNTSDEVPYMHSSCKTKQPLAEISSSELEDMVKPQHFTCNYFNMPHGSDSEPLNDTLSTTSKLKPKSSGAVVKSKTHDTISVESVENRGGISASLPSFATVDFHMSDNKVHPLPHPDAEKTTRDEYPDTASGNRGQVKEQDSLDKLQYICGQHCPILSALILPVNQVDRGFAYCRPNDIENLLFLQPASTSTSDIALLNNCAITDENNNIKCEKGRVNTCENIHIHHQCNEESKKLNTCLNLKKRSDCLSELYPNTASTIARIITLYKHFHTSNFFQELPCVRNDENNNILYYHT
ncbi:oxygen-regulated protein 1-like [Phyllobates terribilis]|uniref:oxygen-regulated protein 1-like n=1 Tax=Phyllobates terribilis TaxID=111132 RepID=UPI003CCAFD16